MRAAVLGSPIAHSLSPALHRAAYAQLGLDWRYDAIEVDEAAHQMRLTTEFDPFKTVTCDPALLGEQAGDRSF